MQFLGLRTNNTHPTNQPKISAKSSEDFSTDHFHFKILPVVLSLQRILAFNFQCNCVCYHIDWKFLLLKTNENAGRIFFFFSGPKYELKIYTNNVLKCVACMLRL